MTTRIVEADQTPAEALLDKLNSLEPVEDGQDVFMTVNGKWQVRIHWTESDGDYETFPIESLLNTRPELVNELYGADTTRQFINACKDISSYTEPRGYTTSAGALTWWETVKLETYNFLGML